MFSNEDFMKPSLRGAIRLEASGEVPVGFLFRPSLLGRLLWMEPAGR